MCVINRDKKKIALVDKYALTRCGFVHFVTSLGGYEVVIQVDYIQALGGVIDNSPVDILVTDLFGSADDIDSQINDIYYYHRRYPAMQIVVYTSVQDKKVLMSLRDVAKFSVISRREPSDEINDYLELALNGVSIVSPIIKNIIHTPLDKYSLRPIGLTNQESEVLSFLLNGMNLTQIARIKNRSIKTVSAQKCSGMRKLGAANDADLFLYKRAFLKV